jgi:hypothetical protein
VGTAYYKITPTSKMRKAKKRKAAGPVGLKGAAGGGTLAEGSMIQVMSGDASPLGSSHDWFDAPESGIPAQPPSKVQRADESAESSQVSSARMTTDADTGIDYKNALRDVRDDREGTEKYLNGIDALDSIICKEPRKVAIIRDTIHNEPEFSSLRLRDLFESRIGAHWRPVMIQPDKEFDNVYHVHSVDPYTFWNPIQTKQNDRNYVPSSISLKSDGKIALEESKLHFDLDNNEALYEGLFKPDKPQLWCEVRLTVEKNADGSVPSDTDSIEVRPCSNTQEFDRNILMNQKKTQAHPHILESAHPPGTSYAQEKSSDIQRSRHY